MASDPILAPLTIPDEPAPKDAEVDAGHEFTEVAVDRFLLRLTKPEKDLIAVIGGISVVSLDNRCMVRNKTSYNDQLFRCSPKMASGISILIHVDDLK